ncbi:DUF996 domain-containing protein [Thermococcus sp. AM4]|uniref:DUF996 domain-containing protein n=1 Tax=Thermococcus sp. (strain AM4) TaxID=246969 RepID=UPI0001870EAC|nr:DUF996 domain-containing protein [Thermococcus sp. AM4]EEB73064.1 conserved hypothetical protein [Thermococcus sp. AM4]
MAELKNAKMLGGIGAILSVIGLGFIGFILKLLAVKQISEATGNEDIFNKYLWAAITNIIGGIIVFGSFMAAIRSGKFGVGVLGLGGFIAVVLLIVGAWFMKQSYDLIAEETGVGMFHTVALLYIVGAILMIFLIGGLLIAIAAILEIVAYFSLPDTLEKSSPTPTAEF